RTRLGLSVRFGSLRGPLRRGVQRPDIPFPRLRWSLFHGPVSVARLRHRDGDACFLRCTFRYRNALVSAISTSQVSLHPALSPGSGAAEREPSELETALGPHYRGAPVSFNRRPRTCGSAGLVKWKSNPASWVLRRSSSCPQPVRATSVMLASAG